MPSARGLLCVRCKPCACSVKAQRWRIDHSCPKLLFMDISEISSAASGASSPSVNAEALAVLQALRDELDGIDWRLMETLRQRLDCCCRIGLHKRDHAIPMMQPQRIGLVQQRAAEFAVNHGIRSDFLRSLYALIIEETCRLELEVINAPAGASRG